MDGEMPLISVIVPVYNVEKYLKKCVDSLLDQKYPNLEIVLVDDGSPDNSPQMCDDFAKKYENITSLHKANGGLGSARNYGVERCGGNWIVFVDSDDYVRPEYISYMWDLHMKYEADMVSCGVTQEDESGKELLKSTEKEITVLSGKEAFFAIYFAKKSGHRSYSKLLKKSQLLKHPFPAGYFEDFATTYHWLEDCDSVVLGDGAENYRYVQRGGSILNSQLSEKHLHAFDICDEIKEFVDEKQPEFSKYISLIYQGQVIQILNKQHMSMEQYSAIYKKYRGMFRRSLPVIVFSSKFKLSTKLYSCLLCLTPGLYRSIRNSLWA